MFSDEFCVLPVSSIRHSSTVLGDVIIKHYFAIPVAARSKTLVCCQVDFSASSWSLVQMDPTECGVSWVWSWIRDNKEALAHGGGGLLRHGENKVRIMII